MGHWLEWVCIRKFPHVSFLGSKSKAGFLCHIASLVSVQTRDHLLTRTICTSSKYLILLWKCYLTSCSCLQLCVTGLWFCSQDCWAKFGTSTKSGTAFKAANSLFLYMCFSLFYIVKLNMWSITCITIWFTDKVKYCLDLLFMIHRNEWCSNTNTWHLVI